MPPSRGTIRQKYPGADRDNVEAWNIFVFFNLLLISKTLEWFLYLFIAFSTDFISFLSVSMM